MPGEPTREGEDDATTCESFSDLRACSPPKVRSVSHFSIWIHICCARRGSVENCRFGEFGRVLYHLNQRRGFKSNRKSGSSDEDKGILKKISILQEEITSSGKGTLGAFLQSKQAESAALHGVPDRIRARHTRRPMYKHELETLWERQSNYHPETLTSKLRERVEHIIFYQRPFEVSVARLAKLPKRANAWRSPQVGPCELEPTEKRVERGSWWAQEFRLHKEVNNLKVRHADGAERELTIDERDVILDHLQCVKTTTFSALHKKILLPPDATFNLQAGGRKQLKGNILEASLASAFGKDAWRRLDEGVRQRVRVAVVEEEDEVELEKILVEADAPNEKIDDLLNLPLPDGHLKISALAIRKLLPHLRAGLKEYDARIEAGYAADDLAPALPRLPSTARISNPVVKRALTETRKVVNAILREFELPEQIVIETARDLKQGKKGKQEATKKMRRLERQRSAARKDLSDRSSGREPTREDIRRYLMWKEQGGICPYTGEVH